MWRGSATFTATAATAKVTATAIKLWTGDLTTATAEACEHDTSLTWLLIGVFVMIAACWAAVHGTKGDHY